VWVSQLTNGTVRVSGQLSADGGSTLINGKQSVVFSKPVNIVANLGGGRDEIKLFSTQVSGRIQILTGDLANGTNDADIVEVFNARTNGLLVIRTGSGIDNVTVQNSRIGDGVGVDDLTISSGVASAPGQSDLDTVKLKNVITRGATFINTGASSDYLDIQDSLLGNDVNDFLQINTGAGSDSVSIAPGQSGLFQRVFGNIVITTFDSESELDIDHVKLQQLNFNSARVRLGGGNDTVDMLGVTGVSGPNTNTTIQLEGMGGDDTMKLTEVEAIDNFFALMGDGSDTLDLTFVKANKSMTLDGGIFFGTDRLEKHQMPFNPNFTQKNWEFINGIPQLVAFPDNGVLTPTRA
jgi:hypothetical protein